MRDCLKILSGVLGLSLVIRVWLGWDGLVGVGEGEEEGICYISKGIWVLGYCV